ncbi:hypothetical protein AMTRI_Chr03g145300 [Amborella trichopoda]|uniref:Peroxin-7 n=1 Tax=Amborella trichopoda TaxID=13333 RepID=U5D2E0_AMBTC|nr:hypothetical protein AMTR_s00048p00129360 [Amborella trichopoda]
MSMSEGSERSMEHRSYFLFPLNGEAVRFNPNPVCSSTLAVATSISGSFGHMKVFRFNSDHSLLDHVHDIYSAVGLTACAWSPLRQDHIASTHNGHGCVFMLNTRTRSIAWHPPPGHAHASIVTALEWDPHGRETLVSGSWDSTIKLWTPYSAAGCISTMHNPNIAHVTGVSWGPIPWNGFASVSYNGSLCLWDPRMRTLASELARGEHAFSCCDWSKASSSCYIATGSCSGLIKVWDMRGSREPVSAWQGHDNKRVRGVRFSPSVQNVIASFSTGSEVCMWSDVTTVEAQLARKYSMHTGSIKGIDMSTDGVLASIGSDYKLITIVYAHDRQEVEVAQ